jgi:hypothetical protein
MTSMLLACLLRAGPRAVTAAHSVTVIVHGLRWAFSALRAITGSAAATKIGRALTVTVCTHSRSSSSVALHMPMNDLTVAELRGAHLAC